jgi:hypothetical protein
MPKTMVKIIIDESTTHKAEELFDRYYKQFGNIVSAEMQNELPRVEFTLTLINEDNDIMIIKNGLTSGYIGNGANATIRVLNKAGFKDIDELVHTKGSFKLNLERKIKMITKLKYHDVSDDEKLNKIREDRENLWSNLINDYLKTQKPWNTEQLSSMIRSLQEYFSVDTPENMDLNSKQYRRAIDNLSRISVFLLGLLTGDKEFDKDHADYVTKKLIEIFLELKIGKE